MNDPRLTPFNGHVAHMSLKGQIDAAHFSAGEQMQVAVTKTALLRTPDGEMDRELLLGRKFLVLDTESASPWVYGIADLDGYCGWVHGQNLATAQAATHKVAVRESYFKATPDLKKTELTYPAFLGSEVVVTDAKGEWSQFALEQPITGETQSFYLPTCHLRPVSKRAQDPVEVARAFCELAWLARLSWLFAAPILRMVMLFLSIACESIRSLL